MVTGPPAARPVTTPAASIEAMAGFDEVQGVVADGVPEPVNVTVAPSHKLEAPVIVGKATTVTSWVIGHPVLSVYVILAVPPAIPVTVPVALTVAIAGASDVQALVAAGVPDPMSVLVLPSHKVNVPLIVGAGLTVTACVVVQPLMSV